MQKKCEYVKLKNYERKIKSSFITYADFESILVPENNGKEHPEASYTNKKQNIILLAVIALNQYALMISLVSLLRHTETKMKYTILLVV